MERVQVRQAYGVGLYLSCVLEIQPIDGELAVFLIGRSVGLIWSGHWAIVQICWV